MAVVIDFQIALYVLALCFAFMLRAPVRVVGCALTVLLLLTPFVDLRSVLALERYAFWNTVAVILGATVGGLLGFVIQSESFVRSRDMLADRGKAWRALLLGVSLVGAALWQSLVPWRWLDWIVSLLAYTLLIALSALTYRSGRTAQLISAGAVLVMHFWWLVFVASAMLALGLCDSLVPSAARYRPVCVTAVAGAQLLTLLLLDKLFPYRMPLAPRSSFAQDALGDAIDSMTGADAQACYNSALAECAEVRERQRQSQSQPHKRALEITST